MLNTSITIPPFFLIDQLFIELHCDVLFSYEIVNIVINQNKTAEEGNRIGKSTKE